MKKVYNIDGQNFSTLEEFYEEFGKEVLSANWGHNLDAFNDVLRGGFGTPDEGFVLVWKNSNVSQKRLGYPETLKQLRLRFERCHPSNRDSVKKDLEKAEKNEGPTVFDWLVEIIQSHDNIKLVLT